MFWLLCGGLLLLVVVLLWLPMRHLGQDISLRQANLDWYQQRDQELALESGDGSSLQDDAKLRLLEDSADDADSEAVPTSTGVFRSWWLLPPVTALAVLLYLDMGAMTDVRISQTLSTLSNAEEISEQQYAALFEQLEQRLAQRPEKIEYLQLLGSMYMGRGNYTEATMAYQRLVEQQPYDPQALARAAQASYMASDRQLSDQSRRLAEQALALAPHQRTALGLLGMEAYEQGQFKVAIHYWERLLAVESAGSSSAQMIAGILESAREKLGADAPTPVAQSAQNMIGVLVDIDLAEDAVVEDADTVFVSLRNPAASSRMPVAVARLSGAQLPLSLRLDDSYSIGGQSLEAIPEVMVVVMVSPSGQPGAENASLMVEVGPVTPMVDAEPVRATLIPR